MTLSFLTARNSSRGLRGYSSLMSQRVVAFRTASGDLY